MKLRNLEFEDLPRGQEPLRNIPRLLARFLTPFFDPEAHSRNSKRKRERTGGIVGTGSPSSGSSASGPSPPMTGELEECRSESSTCGSIIIESNEPEVPGPDWLDFELSDINLVLAGLSGDS